MKFGSYMMSFLALLSLMSVLLAAQTDPKASIANTLACLQDTIKNALAIGMLLLVVLAAVVYAVGQMMGAETRARASVWATAMFTGAIVGALIYLLVPYILNLLLGGKDSGVDVTTTPTCTAGATP